MLFHSTTRQRVRLYLVKFKSIYIIHSPLDIYIFASLLAIHFGLQVNDDVVTIETERIFELLTSFHYDDNIFLRYITSHLVSYKQGREMIE